MNFKKALHEGCYSLHLESDTKDDIITEMVDILVAENKVTDRDAALKAVFDREHKMSTGMQCGVAIPHGKTTTVSGLYTVFAIKKEGVEFASLDGQPASIFILTLSSSNKTGQHMQYLSEISKILNSESMRSKILAATTEEQLVELLSE